VPTYDFKATDGHEVSIDMTADQFVGLPTGRPPGERIEVVYMKGPNGQRYYRKRPQLGGIVGGLSHYDDNKYPKVSYAAERNSGHDLKLDHTPGGKVIFANKHQQDDYCRANGYTRDYSANDPAPKKQLDSFEFSRKQTNREDRDERAAFSQTRHNGSAPKLAPFTYEQFIRGEVK